MRNLTLYGKVSVIKAHLQSQMVYQLSVLPTPNKAFFKKVEKTLFQYLWSNKPDKIKRNLLYNKKDNGGIDMPSIEAQNQSLKISWVHKLIKQPNSSWAKLAIKQIPPGGTIVFTGNITSNYLTTLTLMVKSRFWNDVLLAWCKLSYEESIKKGSFNQQSIWYSSNVKLNKSWFTRKNGAVQALIT